MNMINKKTPPSAEEKDIIEYLQNNPDFFSRHPSVLETLYLPHNSGTAVSLIEKQLSVLRSRNTEMRTQLKTLMETSKANDKLFTLSRNLVLKLLGEDSPSAIVTTLLNSFKSEFKIEFSSLTLIDPAVETPAANILSGETAKEKIAAIIDTDEPVCGVLRSQQLIALFGQDAKLIGSAVALRLAISNQAYGVLALGNRDSHYYHGGMDTLFLRFLADILNKVLQPRL